MRRLASCSPAMQAAALRGRFRDSQIRMSGTSMTWTATLRPSPFSRDYTVRISYTRGRFPRVEVLPRPPSRPGEPLPHVYGDGSLCLHRVGEWSPDMLIADTIVPWACEWLIHYEIWLATGEWHGGGEEPSVDEQTNGFADGTSGSRRDRRARHGRSRRRRLRRARHAATAPRV